jgi:hypothetical protein
MISSFDDYCVHQTSDYLRVPGTTDRNFYDRYFFSGYSIDGRIMFGVAYGRYPNRFVQDAHFTVTVDGHQHSLHASDALGGDPAASCVGPISVQVEQPMRRLRCTVADNPHGIRCDLLYEAESGAVDEGRLRVARHGMTYIDQTRFMQYGRWSGWIEIDGRRITLGKAYGLRDKSWGVRAIGEQQVTAKPGERIFWMNIVLRLPTGFCVFRTLDHGDGSSHEREGYEAPLYASAEAVPVGEPHLTQATQWEFALRFAGDSRRIIGGDYQVKWADGGVFEFQARCRNTLWYAGMGYNHDRWHHGLDHGEKLVLERESWRVDGVDDRALDRQFLASMVDILCDGEVVGFGHTEQLLLGDYTPFGWEGCGLTGVGAASAGHSLGYRPE